MPQPKKTDDVVVDDTKPTVDEAALAAFTAGVEDANAGMTPATIPDPTVTDTEEVADGDVVVLVDAEGKPVEAPKPADKPVAKPADTAAPKAEVKADDKPALDAAVEKEITDLGLVKPSAQARFRELSAQVKEGAELRESLKAAGIIDLAQLPQGLKQLATRAQAADRFEQMVESTQASDEQLGAAFGYLALVNSGDPVKMQAAFDAMSKEQAWLAEQLGQPAPGVDPLDAHADLKAKVQNGSMERADALEMVGLRAKHKLVEKREQTTTTQRTAKQLSDDGFAEVVALGSELIAAEAAKLGGNAEAGKRVFLAKNEAIAAGVRIVQRDLPPAKWKAAVKELYDAVKLAAPAPAPRTKISEQPLRPTGARGANITPKPANDMAAFNLGLAAAKDSGY